MQSNHGRMEEKEFYKIVPLKMLRKTAGVIFDIIPIKEIPSIEALDRVIHQNGALSPGPIGTNQRPWYMHPHQKDHLLVLAGSRSIELYCLKTKQRAEFVITPFSIHVNNSLVSDSPVMLCWDTFVFHRIISDDKHGSSSINIASRSAEFDIRSNFNIYDLDQNSGQYTILREGHLDQPVE